MRSKVFLPFIQLLLLDIAGKLRPAEAILGNGVEPVEPNEFATVVCIARYRPRRSMSRNIFCSGVLISTEHILTADECFDELQKHPGEPMEVLISNGDLSQSTSTYPLWWIGYTNWIQHQQALPVERFNNIGVIKMFGVMPRMQVSFISDLSPQTLLEGYRVQVVGCGVPNQNVVPTMIQKAQLRVIKRETCQQIVTELEGLELVVPTNFLCTNNNPYTHLQKNDRGGPVFFFDTLVGINVGVFPHMEGQFDSNQINAHIGIDLYRIFIFDLLNY